jgi:hypothetical protein
MFGVTAYQLLQVIGLSLPFLALYLTVLVEIHKLPKPIKVSSGILQVLPPEIHPAPEENEEWVGTVTLSYAYQNWDFVLAVSSIGFILLSAMAVIVNIAFSHNIIRLISYILFLLSYLSAFFSVVFTLSYCYSNFTPDD